MNDGVFVREGVALLVKAGVRVGVLAGVEVGEGVASSVTFACVEVVEGSGGGAVEGVCWQPVELTRKTTEREMDPMMEV